MLIVLGFFAGALFAIGLVLGGMTDPKNVIAFLDVTGEWDPSLALVMVGGIVTFGLVYHLARRQRTKPLFAPEFSTPFTNDLTPRLIVGAAIFGIGWGLSGLCPGPALTSVFVDFNILFFVVAMFVGIFLGKIWDSVSERDESTAPEISS